MYNINIGYLPRYKPVNVKKTHTKVRPGYPASHPLLKFHILFFFLRSYSSSETSSYTSECQDDEEIALAIQAAELSARREARARFKSSGDLIHRLFVCISGRSY